MKLLKDKQQIRINVRNEQLLTIINKCILINKTIINM